MRRLDMIRSQISHNGLRWTLYSVLSEQLAKVSNGLRSRMTKLEKRHGLPGTNTIEQNREVWESYDWSLGGEEWTRSPEWKQSLVDDVMFRWIRSGSTILEIGPGAGRWTEFLQRLAHRLILVDLSESCIQKCRERFSDCDNMSYFVNDGASLSFLESSSIDFIWSFDVFVHISPIDADNYLREFKRVLRKGGRGIVHHGDRDAPFGGWRSSLNAGRFKELLLRNGLRPVAHFDSWGTGDHARLRYDVIEVFER